MAQATGVFDGYSLAELRALVLRRLRVTDTTRYSVASTSDDYSWIDDAINRGQDEFVRKTKCLRSYAIIELQANQRIYRLPDDYLDLMSAYYYNPAKSAGYSELTINTIEELNDEISDWRTDTGIPTRFYIDRNYGAGMTFGLYPIPSTDGETQTITTEYGAGVTWLCPLYTYNQDYGMVIKLDGNDEYVLPDQCGVAVDPTIANYNLLMEYYRLPQELNAADTDTSQVSSIPREYQMAIVYYAAYNLLSNNPEDSEENKRAASSLGLFEREVESYIDKRKRPISGRNLQARSNAWGWMNNMKYYSEQP